MKVRARSVPFYRRMKDEKNAASDGGFAKNQWSIERIRVMASLAPDQIDRPKPQNDPFHGFPSIKARMNISKAACFLPS